MLEQREQWGTGSPSTPAMCCPRSRILGKSPSRRGWARLESGGLERAAAVAVLEGCGVSLIFQ